jgi:hypothetical protein
MLKAIVRIWHNCLTFQISLSQQGANWCISNGIFFCLRDAIAIGIGYTIDFVTLLLTLPGVNARGFFDLRVNLH